MAEQQIFDVAAQYLKKHPTATNREVNLMLRAKHGGRFLARVTFDKIRALPFGVVFIKSVIPGQEVAALQRGGFTEREAKYLWGGWKLSINSPAFVAMRLGRIKWWADLKKKGYTRAQIWAALNKQYQVPKYNPFDWLDREYGFQPTRLRITSLQHYQAVAAKRKKRAISATKPAFRLTKTKPRPTVTTTVKGETVEF